MVLKQLKLRIRRRRLRQHGLVVEVNLPTVTYGQPKSCTWTIHPDFITPRSVVYSFGVGCDAEWDLAMIKHHGVTVHAFDPTPKSIQWVNQQRWPEQFKFHPVGVAAHDGQIEFYPPRNGGASHYSPVDRGFAFDRATLVQAPVKRLESLARELNHDSIDLLKMDIEGGEYNTLPDMLRSGPPVRQLLIEFHHNFRTLTIDHTLEAVKLLHEHGYRIFHISSRALEFGFIRP